MTTKKSYSRKAPKYAARKHHKDKRLPLSALVGLGVSVVAPPAPGWETVMSAITRGAWDFALQSFVRSWTGIAIGGIGGVRTTYFNLAAALNPMDMNEAPAWKAMFWTALGTKLVKKFTKQDPISKIPVLGKFLKFA